MVGNVRCREGNTSALLIEGEPPSFLISRGERGVLRKKSERKKKGASLHLGRGVSSANLLPGGKKASQSLSSWGGGGKRSPISWGYSSDKKENEALPFTLRRGGGGGGEPFFGGAQGSRGGER